MPINLNNLPTTKVVKKKTLSGTFFHKALTGHGGAVGFFKPEINNLKAIRTLRKVATPASTEMVYEVTDKQRQYEKSSEWIILPWYGVPMYNAFVEETTAKSPILGLDSISNKKIWTELEDLEFIIDPSQNLKAFTTVKAQSLIVVEYEKGIQGIKPANFTMDGLIFETVITSDIANLDNPDFPVTMTSSLLNLTQADWDDVEQGRKAIVVLREGFEDISQSQRDIDKVLDLDLSRLLDEYARIISENTTPLYAELTKLAARTIDPTDTAMSREWHELFVSHYQMAKRLPELKNADFAQLYDVLKKMALTGQISSNIVNNTASMNLRMMLAAKLEELRALKDADGFYKFPFSQDVLDDFTTSADYSKEQMKVITSNEPLIVAAAGAGTGKSHTLTGRLKYLKEQGQDLNKVLVLSFTNTAAKNISARYPGIQSLTLADMFNQIYSATFPNQMLTNPNTLANTLQLLNPNNATFKNAKTKNMRALLTDFTKLIEELEPKGFKKADLNKVMADMSNLIQDNMEDVIMILNAVGQTTLSLQPIIINAALNLGWPKLQMPAALETIDIIITDESQDISTFEYIMLLDMALRRKAQLLIVGDGAQTLYEFRNSNPKFLTSIQASKVFANYNLTTNYRSSGTILAYANPLLSIIEANDEAKIQLVPQNLAEIQPSEQDFKDHIEIRNQSIGTAKNKEALLAGVDKAIINASDWVLNALSRGEKVAVIASTNAAVEQAKESLLPELERKLQTMTNKPDFVPFHLQSKRNKPNDMTSSLLVDIPRKEIEQIALDYSTVMDANDATLELFSTYWAKRISAAKRNTAFTDLPYTVVNLLEKAFQNAGVLYAFNNATKTNNGFASQLINVLIKEETRYNDFAQLIDPQNDASKELEASNLVFVTGHSAKGLEFDNVVVIYDETHAHHSFQDSLRMLYVTLTRAKKNELIINLIRSTNRTVSNTFMNLHKTPISSLELMTKQFAKTGEYETVIATGNDSSDDE